MSDDAKADGVGVPSPDGPLRKSDWLKIDPRLSARARVILWQNGVRSPEHLAAMSTDDVLDWRNVGKTTLEEYRGMLRRRGLAFRDDTPGSFGSSTYTNDVQKDFDALLERLRSCDGIQSDAVIITWEAARTLLDGVAGLRARVFASELPRGACGYGYHHKDCTCNGEGGDR